MKIFAFSGLGVDERVFENLKIDCDLIHLPWLDFSPKMNLEDYAKSYKELLPEGEKFGVLGLSFGGLMAVELTKIVKPEFCILISSAETYHDLPHVYRRFGQFGIHKLLPASFFIPPFFMANYFFKPKDKSLLAQILKDSDPKFNKWAMHNLLTWSNEVRLKNVLKIHGTKDKLIPFPKDKTTVPVEKAGHFMIHNQANELSGIINKYLLNTKES